MKMTTTENGIKKLVPEDGMFLTNGEVIAEGEVWLGKLDSESNWHEVTPEEKAAIEKQLEEAIDPQKFNREYEETDIPIEQHEKLEEGLEDEHRA